MLAKVDEAHETLSGPATKTILYRGLYEYKDATYKRLANISVAHIYNLRTTAAYRKWRVVFQKTKPTSVSIGERRKPETKGRPGFIRVDTVHALRLRKQIWMAAMNEKRIPSTDPLL